MGKTMQATRETTAKWLEYEKLLPGQYARLGMLWVGLVDVSPASADWILKERNTGNRPFVEMAWRRYATAIGADMWSLTGETIVFDWEGILRNGQNRLKAVVMANRSIKTLVVLGVDPKAFMDMDQGKSRTFSDVLAIQNVEHYKITATALTFLRNFERSGCFQRFTKQGAHMGELLALYEQHPELVESVVLAVAAPRFAHHLFRGQPCIAAFHYLTSKVNKSLADAFMLHLFEGSLPTTEEWSGVREMYKRLSEDASTKGKKITPTMHTALLVKGWNALLEARRVNVISWKPAVEEFPRITGYLYAEGKPIGIDPAHAAPLAGG